MKRPISALLTVAFCLGVHAQETTKPAPKAQSAVEADPTLKVLETLKPEQVEKIRKLVNEASTFVGGIRLQEALARLTEAEAMAPDLFMVHNLKGAVFTKMKEFPKAREAFDKAMKLNPGSFQPKFNLAEIDFVTAANKVRAGNAAAAAEDWAKAEKGLKNLLTTQGVDTGTKKLVEFKLVITSLFLKKEDEAKKMLESFSYLDDEPVYHMSHAAEQYFRGNKTEAQDWTASASRIYPPQAVTIYVDSFIELGWVESLGS